MQISMQKRPDGRVNVWANLRVTWRGELDGVAGKFERLLGYETEEPVIVEVLDPSLGERSEFLARHRESAPLWAGDGFGSSLSKES